MDAGQTTELIGFEDVHVWGVDRHPAAPEEVYVGTEPPGLYRRRGHDREFTSLDGLHSVPSRDEWTFFYDPFEAGHVHGVSAHPDRPDRLFAAVEIGGVLWSDDRGETWSDALASGDFHRTAVDPADPDHVFATGETGLYESRDGGLSWDVIDATAGYYCGDIAFDSQGNAYLTGGDGPGAKECLIWSAEGGEWDKRARLPVAGVAGRFSLGALGDHLVHASSVVKGSDDARDCLAVSRDGGSTWTRLGPTIPTVRAIDHVTL